MPDGKYAGFHVPGEAGKPHIIIVDKAGRRIGNEVGSYMEFGQKMYARGIITSPNMVILGLVAPTAAGHSGASIIRR